MLAGDVLIVQADENVGEKSFIAAFDKTTGREVWRQSRPVQSSWATPVLVELQISNSRLQTQLVTAGNQFVIAYEPKTGVELWRTKGVDSNAIPSPILVGDLLYLSTDRGIITALDAKTGEVRYEGGRVPVPASFTASMVAFGDKILQSSEDGDVLRDPGGPRAQGDHDQQTRRADLRKPGALEQHDLYPRRAAPLRDSIMAVPLLGAGCWCWCCT